MILARIGRSTSQPEEEKMDRTFVRSLALKVRFAAACTALAALAAPALAAEDIRVGTVMGFSGLFGAYGNPLFETFNMALEEAGGEAAGRKIVILKEDDKTDPKYAIQLVRRLIHDEKVDFLLGPVYTPIAAEIGRAHV